VSFVYFLSVGNVSFNLQPRPVTRAFLDASSAGRFQVTLLLLSGDGAPVARRMWPPGFRQPSFLRDPGSRALAGAACYYFATRAACPAETRGGVLAAPGPKALAILGGGDAVGGPLVAADAPVAGSFISKKAGQGDRADQGVAPHAKKTSALEISRSRASLFSSESNAERRPGRLRTARVRPMRISRASAPRFCRGCREAAGRRSRGMIANIGRATHIAMVGLNPRRRFAYRVGAGSCSW